MGTVVGLGLAVALVAPWWRGRPDSPFSPAWGFTVGLAAIIGTGIWLESGMTLPGAMAGAGGFALGGLLLWPQFHRSTQRQHRQFEQTLSALLTGQRAWDAPTLTHLFRTVPPAELPRLQATVRYLYQNQPELRPLLSHFLEKP
ncbi:hypothetical protein [Gloeomargarita lithophora]|uniref:hypothetical protein n=1 Tax=Gloeomargarita lithophora TaxID=1188228 RepID=UPI0012FDFA5B|nr:hypothetical protein [Gloeomargarita lithophora]